MMAHSVYALGWLLGAEAPLMTPSGLGSFFLGIWCVRYSPYLMMSTALPYTGVIDLLSDLWRLI